MRVPDLRETVGVIMKAYPYASHVLKRHGIDDLLWFSGTALEDACKQMKVDARVVAEEIAREGMEPPKPRSALIYDPASEQQMKAAAAAERAAIEAEFQADEAADVAAQVEAAGKPAPKPDEDIPDVAALFKKRPSEPEAAAPQRPRRTARMRADSSDTGAPLPATPEPKQLTPEELAEQKAKADAKAKAEAELAASIPDVSSAFRARPVAPPPPPPADAPPPPTPKGELEIPPKDSGSMLSKIMSWGQEEKS